MQQTDSSKTALPGIDLARYILPNEIFNYFTLVQIKEEGNNLHFYLEELNILPAEYSAGDMESKGFHKESVIKDFPLREKALYLHVRRRRWLHKDTGEVVSRDWHLVAEGTHYTQGYRSLGAHTEGIASSSKGNNS